MKTLADDWQDPKRKRLRQRVREAEKSYEKWPDHTSEVALILARRDYREYVEGRTP